jgi:hypothetical protein
MKAFFTVATSTAFTVAVALQTIKGGGVSAFSVDQPNVSRREAFQAAAAFTTAAAIGILPVNAMPTEETPRTITRMGGLLVSIFTTLWTQKRSSSLVSRMHIFS